jgi:hypothetical protein
VEWERDSETGYPHVTFTSGRARAAQSPC